MLARNAALTLSGRAICRKLCSYLPHKKGIISESNQEGKHVCQVTYTCQELCSLTFMTLCFHIDEPCWHRIGIKFHSLPQTGTKQPPKLFSHILLRVCVNILVISSIARCSILQEHCLITSLNRLGKIILL